MAAQLRPREQPTTEARRPRNGREPAGDDRARDAEARGRQLQRLVGRRGTPGADNHPRIKLPGWNLLDEAERNAGVGGQAVGAERVDRGGDADSQERAHQNRCRKAKSPGVGARCSRVTRGVLDESDRVDTRNPHALEMSSIDRGSTHGRSRRPTDWALSCQACPSGPARSRRVPMPNTITDRSRRGVAWSAAAPC
jgi:hypothetical protein